MRLWIFLLIPTLFAAAASAQTARVRSLYESRSFLPGVLIPFQVQAPNRALRTDITSITTTAPRSADCRTLQDPFHSGVFHLKCQGVTATPFQIRVRFLAGNQAYQISYDNIQIANPGGGVVVVEPEPPAIDPAIISGKNLYASYCLSCHTKNDNRNVTASRIRNAINGVSRMRTTQGLTSLTDAQLRDMEAYLKSAVP